MSTLLKLQMAEGFRETASRPCGRKIVWEDNGTLNVGDSDFAQPEFLGHIGGVDCPIALDAKRGVAWVYCCQYRLGVKDYSEIREFDLTTRRSRRLLRLGLHQWAIWMLTHWAEANSLLALVATDTRAAMVHIRHHLALIDTRSGQMHLVALPRDAFVPLAICTRRRWVIFHGAEGTHLISIQGRHLKTLPPGGPAGRGASIHPVRPLALVGGDGIWLWDLEKGTSTRIRDRGQFPHWSPDGRGFWFSESSSDLFYWNYETGAEKRVLRFVGNPYPEINYSRPITISPDGKRLAVSLTRMLKVDPDVLEKTPTLARLHRMCVVDLEKCEAWIAPGYARNFAWV